MRGLARFVVVATALLVVLGGLAAGAGWFWLDRYLERPGPLASETTLVLERGWGVARIADELADAGVIAHPRAFHVAARLFERDRSLKAGEYAFAAGISPVEVIDILERGDVLLHAVTVPEGLTTFEVAAIIADAPVLDGAMPDLAGEGRYLPETYLVPRGLERSVLVERMRRAMDEALTQAWEARTDDLPIADTDELLILASIIEKETALHEEYGLVAGVFVNRLRRGMRLQTDPTVIYGLTEGQGPLGRPLTRKDLQTEHPYNTYIIDRLPPGPIANPGRAAIEAAARPADTDYLYFVADGTGGHAFARTLDEHNRNVRQWRRINSGG